MRRWITHMAVIVCTAMLAGIPSQTIAQSSTPSPASAVQLDEQVLELEAQGHAWLGNVRSRVLHIDTCSNLPKDVNQTVLDSFAQGMEAGYTPCGICLYWVNEDGTSAVLEDTQMEYIGNQKSYKFHKSDCSSLPAEKNRVPLSSREEALEAGYEPCGRCKP